MRAVQRIVAILESFTAEKNSLTLQELADRIGLAKSTTFRIVQSLQRAGYLVRLQDQKYCLSFRLIRLAGLVNSTLSIREIARPITTQLADATKETVSIQTVSGRNRVCIDAVATSMSPLRNVTQPGEHIPLIAGASSKTLAAFMPAKALAPLVAQMARATRRDQASVMDELAKIRKRGWCVSHGERVLGVSAVCAPIKGADDASHYCLSVAGPSIRMREKEKEIIRLVVKAAADISRHYGANIGTD
jgi:DNA-binding IclR family transcriptional regulator